MYVEFFKPLIDRAIALFLMVLLSPVFLIIMLVMMIRVGSGGTIFFIHQRPGLHGKPFGLLKFRTMNEKRDPEGNLLPNMQRITRIGSFLRKTSLDEIPQLLNVLKGDMSLVGPRPLLFKYMPLYNERQKKRHDVLPGITGWAQVNGRNAISWTRKFEFDVYYVEHVNFLFDLKILWLTILKVLRSESVNAGKNVTMPPFNGSN